jgi:hypothetical protein
MQGCLTQTRTLGGSIGLAIAVIIFNGKISESDALNSMLTQVQIGELHKSPLVMSTFGLFQQIQVGAVYADAFTAQMRLALYIAAAAFVISLAKIERNPPLPAKKAVAAAQS